MDLSTHVARRRPSRGRPPRERARRNAASTTLRVPTLTGEVEMKIPAMTSSGRTFRLRGKGVKPVRGGGVGDLLCRAVVETPVNLNKEQKALLEKFRSSLGHGGHAQSPRQTSWFEGVKSFFDDMKI